MLSKIIKSRDKLEAMKEMLEEAGQPRAGIRPLQNLIHRESLESTALGEWPCPIVKPTWSISPYPSWEGQGRGWISRRSMADPST